MKRQKDKQTPASLEEQLAEARADVWIEAYVIAERVRDGCVDDCDFPGASIARHLMQIYAKRGGMELLATRPGRRPAGSSTR